MKQLLILPILLMLSASSSAQYDYEASDKTPFGKLNPNAPEQTADFAPLIGISECTSETRAPDGSWNAAISMIWKWKYIMNGMGVQDETLKSDGIHSGSIRQFNADSTKWYVHYYSSGSASSTLPVWEGLKRENGNIVLYREQTAPNGLDGFYRLTFYEIKDESFKWIGEWVNTDETIVYPTWKIDCAKQKE